MTAAVIIFPVFSQADRKGVKPCGVFVFHKTPESLHLFCLVPGNMPKQPEPLALAPLFSAIVGMKAP